jgi:integrase
MKGVFLIVSPLKTDAGVRAFGFHAIRRLTATILYHKGYGLSLIQQVLRHQNPSTTERYLRSFGIEKVREGLEGAFVRKPAEVIPFSKQKTSNV